MARLRRLAAAAALAAALAAGPGLIDVSAAGSTPARLQVGAVCGALATAIARLQAYPAGPLRDLLLGAAQRVFARYCP